MGSRNISIKREAYDFLKSLKQGEESFSDVILGFKKEKSVLDFFGKLKDKNWDEAENNMKGLRKSIGKRLN